MYFEIGWLRLTLFQQRSVDFHLPSFALPPLHQTAAKQKARHVHDKENAAYIAECHLHTDQI